MATTIAAAGDLIYGTANDAYAALSLGTAGQLLKVNSGATAPEWGAAPSTGANFTLLNAGGTALSGSSTVTISSLNGYDKIRVLVKNISSASASSTIYLRINADSGSNYNMFGRSSKLTSASTAEGLLGRFNGVSETFARVLILGNFALANGDAGILIDGANSIGVKIIEVHSGANGISGAGGEDYPSAVAYNLVGTWNSSSTVTSISLISETGNFDAGTIYVYGSL